MSEHTKGPWKAVLWGKDSPDGISSVESATEVVVRELAQKNAALIAAAPEMYEALLSIAYANGFIDDEWREKHSEAMELVFAVIQKVAENE